MKSRTISRSKTGLFSLAYTNPYVGIGWEYQSTVLCVSQELEVVKNAKTTYFHSFLLSLVSIFSSNALITQKFDVYPSNHWTMKHRSVWPTFILR